MSSGGTACLNGPRTSAEIGTPEWERYWADRMRDAKLNFMYRATSPPSAFMPFSLQTRREVATVLGVDLSTYQAWERGTREAPKALVPAMKFILGANKALALDAIRRKQAGETEVTECPRGFLTALRWYLRQVDVEDDNSAAA